MKWLPRRRRPSSQGRRDAVAASSHRLDNVMNINPGAVVSGAVSGAVTALAIALVLGTSGLIHARPANDNRAIHDYLLGNPQILMAMGQKLHEQQDRAEDDARQAAAEKLGAKVFFDPQVAFLTGPKQASTTFVEFFDYNCPYCRASMALVRKYYAAHRKDTRFAFIEYPIKGQESVIAARAAIASRKQPDKYLDFHFRLMGEAERVTPDIVFADAQKSGLDVAKLKKDMLDPAVDRAMSAAHSLADTVNIDGTPAFIVNGRTREGVLDEKTLARLLKGIKSQTSS
jgi:protein-disulfide isomerase